MVEETGWDELVSEMRRYAPCLQEARDPGQGVTVMFFADPAGNAIQLVKRTTPLLDG